MQIKEISFNDILPVWQNHLWLDRTSEIKSMSSMTLSRTYNMSIYEIYKPYFCAVYDDDSIVGVNSCHQTDIDEFRSRGIYIFPQYRSKNYSSLLFDFVKEKAIENNCTTIWSLPRLSALKSYTNYGFKECSEVINTNVEFGPNVYVKMILEKGHKNVNI